MVTTTRVIGSDPITPLSPEIQTIGSEIMNIQTNPIGLPPLQSRSRSALLRTALAFTATVTAANSQVAIAEKLFVDLRATQPSAGSGTWVNLGVSGNFSVISGTPLKQTLGTVDYVSMDSGTQFVGPPAPTSIAGAETRSVEVWVKNDTVDNEDVMVAWGMRGAEGRNYAFTYGSNATWGALGAWGAPDLGWGATVPAAATLHHLVATYDGNLTKVYSDGVLLNAEAALLNTYDTPNNFILNGGREGDNVTIQRPNVGNLDYAAIRVHDGVLSDAQVLANFNAGVTALPADGDGDGLPDFWEDHYLLGKTDNGTVDPDFGASGDPDEDLATNLAEYQAGTDPQNAASSPSDSDGDSLPDSWENTHFGSLIHAGDDDPDGDFDDNASEFTATTDPDNRGSFTDSDTDQMPDNWELFYFNNDLSQTGLLDNDSDAVIDKTEYTNATNPIDATSTGSPLGDADGDGLDDGWERQYFTTVLVSDGDDNSDGDIADNLTEYLAGSDPTLALSTPTDVNGDGISDVSRILTFSAPGTGGVLDSTGVPTGFDARLPGTGAALPSPDDTNLVLDTTAGSLLLTSTSSDFNGQGTIGEAEAPGIALSSLGFTGSEDLLIRAKFRNLPTFADYDQLGVYVGVDSTRLLRGGLINFGDDGHRPYAVKTVNGGDIDLSMGDGAIAQVLPGLAMTVEIRRTAGVWAFSVNGYNVTPIPDPDVLAGQSNLTAGVFIADVFNTNRQVGELESMTIVRFGAANPDTDNDGLADAWENNNFGDLSQGADGDSGDQDGMTNLQEFAFDGDPKSGTSRGGILSAFADSNANSQKDLTITIPVRAGATFAVDGPRQTATVQGLVYTIEGSLTLGSFTSPVSFVSKVTATNPDYELNTFRLDGSEGISPSPRGFLRAVVNKAP